MKQFNKMENTKKLIQTLTRIQIISSIVWALVLIVCYQVLGDTNKQISLILICGFFLEFLLISSSKKNLKKQIVKPEI
jgi:preprotein translocase subunit SecF